MHRKILKKNPLLNTSPLLFLLWLNSPMQLGKIGEKFIKFLNFCQIRLEPPENENQKVPLAKGGAFPPNAPPK